MAEPGATPSDQLFAGFNAFSSSNWQKTQIEQVFLKVFHLWRILGHPKVGPKIRRLVEISHLPCFTFLGTMCRKQNHVGLQASWFFKPDGLGLGRQDNSFWCHWQALLRRFLLRAGRSGNCFFFTCLLLGRKNPSSLKGLSQDLVHSFKNWE